MMVLNCETVTSGPKTRYFSQTTFFCVSLAGNHLTQKVWFLSPSKEKSINFRYGLFCSQKVARPTILAEFFERFLKKNPSCLGDRFSDKNVFFRRLHDFETILRIYLWISRI